VGLGLQLLRCALLRSSPYLSGAASRVEVAKSDRGQTVRGSGGKRDIRAADPAARGDLYTGALIVSACTIATGVSVDRGVIRRIAESGLL
jgi:hypothetical protein